MEAAPRTPRIANAARVSQARFASPSHDSSTVRTSGSAHPMKTAVRMRPGADGGDDADGARAGPEVGRQFGGEEDADERDAAGGEGGGDRPVERGAEGERGNRSQEDPCDGEGDQQQQTGRVAAGDDLAAPDAERGVEGVETAAFVVGEQVRRGADDRQAGYRGDQQVRAEEEQDRGDDHDHGDDHVLRIGPHGSQVQADEAGDGAHVSAPRRCAARGGRRSARSSGSRAGCPGRTRRSRRFG